MSHKACLPTFLSHSVKRLDGLILEREKILPTELVDRAVDSLWKSFLKLKFAQFEKVCVLVGPSNNGADGLGLALKFLEAQKKVEVFYWSKTSEMGQESSEWQVQRKRLKDRVPFLPVSRFEAAPNTLVVDALFGSGFHGELPNEIQSVFLKLNARHSQAEGSSVQVWAIDLPSGLDAQHLRSSTCTLKANKTFCIGADKSVLHLPHLRQVVGELHFVNIGLAIEECPVDLYLLTKEWAKQIHPERVPLDGHKYSFGRVGIIAGSLRYPGAGILSSLGAFKAGCGYVCVESLAVQSILSALPEIVPGVELSNMDALVYGPGLEGSKHNLAAVLKAGKATVIDGAGFGELVENGFSVLTNRRDVILTPHEGEMATLLACSAHDVRADRLQSLKQLNEKLNGPVIVLKGSGTLIAAGKNYFLSPQGSVGMATAGQGDLLTGVIAAYLARGVSASDAAMLAVFIHGFCGDELIKGASPQGLLAHEIAQGIPFAVRSLMESNQA